MTEKIIVLVSDKDDGRHGEVSVLDDAQKAERLVETLLEAGFEADRIQVFTGRPSDFQVSQRPVVALEVGEKEGEPRPVRERVSRVEAAPQVEAADGVPEAGDEAAETTETKGKEKAATAAQMAAPVRFSSLFRSA